MGTIFRRPDGVWVGRKTVNGKRVERWGKTKAEVARKLNAATPPGPSVTVKEWCERWVKNHPGRDSTRGGTADRFRDHVYPRLGAARVADLTPSRVEALAADLKRDGLHPNTVLLVLANLSAALRAAVRDRVTPENPVALATKPKRVKTPISPLTAAELARVARLDARHLRLVATLAATGLRIGEAVALDVPDWVPTNSTLSVIKTYTPAHGVRPPKSANGVRVVEVPPHLRATLAAAAGTRTSGPLFTSSRGGRQGLTTVRANWLRACKALGIAYRNPHQLRHSYATHALAAGTSPADLAKYLGDTVGTVVKTYLHPSGTPPVAAMAALFARHAPAE